MYMKKLIILLLFPIFIISSGLASESSFVVYNKEITPTSDRIEIPVNNLSNGAYTLLMHTDAEAFKGKFIVLN